LATETFTYHRYCALIGSKVGYGEARKHTSQISGSHRGKYEDVCLLRRCSADSSAEILVKNTIAVVTGFTAQCIEGLKMEMWTT
jgi:hypothetical protein